MISCQQLSRLIASDQLDDASWTRRLAVRVHLLICYRCRGYKAQIAEVGSSVRDLMAEEPTPCPELEAKLLQRCGECGQADQES